MLQVHERAMALQDEAGEGGDGASRPGLHELMQALDILIQEAASPSDGESLVQSQPISTEVANTVYRLLIKREKQKAYDSLLTLQSEIYDMQGKSFAQTHFVSMLDFRVYIFRPGDRHAYQIVR